MHGLLYLHAPLLPLILTATFSALIFTSVILMKMIMKKMPGNRCLYIPQRRKQSNILLNNPKRP